MTDQPETNAPEESFAQLLEAFSPGTRSEVRVGDRVKGKVISIGKDTVFVDAGMKIDAVVERSELLDADQQLTCAEGDELELYVIEILREAQQKSAPVEGKVKEICKGGFTVEVLQRRAFCPQSQIDLSPAEDPSVHVGATYQFLVTRFEDRGRNIIVSRRALLSREL
jgi:small subunit ribosomal protein S1